MAFQIGNSVEITVDRDAADAGNSGKIDVVYADQPGRYGVHMTHRSCGGEELPMPFHLVMVPEDVLRLCEG